MRPAQMPLAKIHERGRMTSASTMPPSRRSTVIESLAHPGMRWTASREKFEKSFRLFLSIRSGIRRVSRVGGVLTRSIGAGSTGDRRAANHRKRFPARRAL